MDLVLVHREVKVKLEGLACLGAEEEVVVVVVLALEKLKALYFREMKANLDLEGLEDCASLLWLKLRLESLAGKTAPLLMKVIPALMMEALVPILKIVCSFMGPVNVKR